MSTPANDPRADVIVVIVSDAEDECIRQTAAALGQAGAVVERCADVYAAASRLNADVERRVRMLLVDMRTADRDETLFLRLAQRYFPWVLTEPLVESRNESAPDVSGAGGLSAKRAVERIARAKGAAAGDNGPPATADRSTVAETSGGLTPAPPHTEKPAESESSQPPPDAASMHDAVRRRMATDAGVTVARRTPPRSAPPMPQPAVLDQEVFGGSARRPAPNLSPEEMKALLEPESEHHRPEPDP